MFASGFGLKGFGFIMLRDGSDVTGETEERIRGLLRMYLEALALRRSFLLRWIRRVSFYVLHE